MAQSLQNKTSTARSALECVQVPRQRMQELREKDSVKHSLDKVNTLANNLEMPPSPSRMNRTLARLRSTTEPGTVLSDPGEAQRRRWYFIVVDLVETELSRTFDQEGIRVAAKTECCQSKLVRSEWSSAPKKRWTDHAYKCSRLYKRLLTFFQRCSNKPGAVWRGWDICWTLCRTLSASPSERSLFSLQWRKTCCKVPRARRGIYHRGYIISNTPGCKSR